MHGFGQTLGEGLGDGGFPGSHGAGDDVEWCSYHVSAVSLLIKMERAPYSGKLGCSF